MTLPFDEPEFLTLRVGGARGEPERLLLIGRPRQGTVRVRQWTSNTLNTAGDVVDRAAGDLLAEVEAAFEARHPVSVEMYQLRQWLAGA